MDEWLSHWTLDREVAASILLPRLDSIRAGDSVSSPSREGVPRGCRLAHIKEPYGSGEKTREVLDKCCRNSTHAWYNLSLGSATLLKLAFLVDSDPNFPPPFSVNGSSDCVF